jgi:hypothetical protein
MTHTAKGDEVCFRIATQKASRLDLMDLEIFGTSASLTAPTIAFEHLLPEASIRSLIQAKPGMSWDGWFHDAFGIRDRNSCR